MCKFIMPQVLVLSCCIIFLYMPFSCTNSSTPDFDSSKPVAVRDSVQVMAAAIARGLSNEGPTAWLHFFAESPGFFMASDGRLAFPDNKRAANFINDTLVKNITKIELKWSNIRIDSLTPAMAMMAASFNEVLINRAGKKIPANGYFTALVQYTNRGWQLRNAHWSIDKENLP